MLLMNALGRITARRPIDYTCSASQHHSIVHGGPGPSFFAGRVVDNIFNGLGSVSARIEGIPDASMKERIQKVEQNSRIE